jgi:hypothetical protein
MLIMVTPDMTMSGDPRHGHPGPRRLRRLRARLPRVHRVARQGSRRPTPVADQAQPLSIPLSAKGHDIGQTVSFTGVGLDSFRCRFFMLPDKLASMASEKRARHGDKPSTPRLVARVLGKALR